ncbi:hypothetical protein CF394_12980 [Tetzosporium hominis]|uniref:Uncharacterized protein n=1 Tax=Tetzosporium hominis TaxID=2020506 RepID=A0A264W119_9BACL|nr:hypothetical protein CF394_12980 [Tetzosporium hominis]
MPDITRVASPVKRLGRFGAALLETAPSQARFKLSQHTSQRFIWLIKEASRFSPRKRASQVKLAKLSTKKPRYQLVARLTL